MTPEKVQELILSLLTDDLRKKPWKGSAIATAGHCYVASECAYHLLGGKSAGWTPMTLRHEGSVHWYLRRGSYILDLTSDQFQTPPDYSLGRGCGFLTRKPSRRAQTILSIITFAA